MTPQTPAEEAWEKFIADSMPELYTNKALFLAGRKSREAEVAQLRDEVERLRNVLESRLRRLNPSGVAGGYAVADKEEYQEIREALGPELPKEGSVE